MQAMMYFYIVFIILGIVFLLPTKGSFLLPDTILNLKQKKKIMDKTKLTKFTAIGNFVLAFVILISILGSVTKNNVMLL